MSPVDQLVANVIEADGRRATARQSPAAELVNHVGMRHAGALFAVGYAASRALVMAALGDDPEAAKVQLLESQIAYEKVVGEETVTATAEPAAGDWDALVERISEGEAVQLPTTVTLTNEGGTTVTAMSVSWLVSPRGSPR